MGKIKFFFPQTTDMIFFEELIYLIHNMFSYNETIPLINEINSKEIRKWKNENSAKQIFVFFNLTDYEEYFKCLFESGEFSYLEMMEILDYVFERNHHQIHSNVKKEELVELLDKYLFEIKLYLEGQEGEGISNYEHWSIKYLREKSDKPLSTEMLKTINYTLENISMYWEVYEISQDEIENLYLFFFDMLIKNYENYIAVFGLLEIIPSNANGNWGGDLAYYESSAIPVKDIQVKWNVSFTNLYILLYMNVDWFFKNRKLIKIKYDAHSPEVELWKILKYDIMKILETNHMSHDFLEARDYFENDIKSSQTFQVDNEEIIKYIKQHGDHYKYSIRDSIIENDMINEKIAYDENYPEIYEWNKKSEISDFVLKVYEELFLEDHIIILKKRYENKFFN